MVYQGSKNKLAKHLKPGIEMFLKPGMSYVEPFVGGANMIDKIEGDSKYGFDINSNLIALLQHFQNSQQDYIYICRDKWKEAKDMCKNGVVNGYIGYVGFICSFCGKYFDGYGNREIAPDRDLNKERYNNILKQSSQEQFKNIIFDTANYKDLQIYNSVIYLDPPYKNTRVYNQIGKFNHNELGEKCKEGKQNGNTILLSELQAPDDNGICLGEKPYKFMLGTSTSKDVTERLYLYVGGE